MAIDDNPLTVFNKQLEDDELEKPVGTHMIVQSARIAGAISGIPPLRPLGFIAKGLDLVGKCLTLGVPTVEENLKLFGKLVEERLIVLETRVDDAEKLQCRTESDEFLQCLASGVLQTQRTTQQNRIQRMAMILANGVREDDLEPESLDDMMRAAVELRDSDILTLRIIYESQISLFQYKRSQDDYALPKVHDIWTNLVESKQIDLPKTRPSLTRLQAFGFIQHDFQSRYGANHEAYVLLEDGRHFYERIQNLSESIS